MKSLKDPNAKEKNKTHEQFGELFLKTDSYDPLPHDSEILEFQQHIYQRVWKEAKELRSSGKLLELGEQIKSPVVAIHGDYDPHPYEGIKNPLSPILKNFRFILLKNCGHYPWVEKKAKNEFYNILKNEIAI